MCGAGDLTGGTLVCGDGDLTTGTLVDSLPATLGSVLRPVGPVSVRCKLDEKVSLIASFYFSVATHQRIQLCGQIRSRDTLYGTGSEQPKHKSTELSLVWAADLWSGQQISGLDRQISGLDRQISGLDRQISGLDRQQISDVYIYNRSLVWAADLWIWTDSRSLMCIYTTDLRSRQQISGSGQTADL